MTEHPVKFYHGPERRSDWHSPSDCENMITVQEAMSAVNTRLEDGTKRMSRIEDSVTAVNDCIKANNDAALVHRIKFEKTLEENTQATADILDIITAAKGFFKVASAVGSVVKWVTGIAAACIGLWVTIKGQLR
jgi:hypothetical protein